MTTVTRSSTLLVLTLLLLLAGTTLFLHHAQTGRPAMRDLAPSGQRTAAEDAEQEPASPRAATTRTPDDDAGVSGGPFEHPVALLRAGATSRAEALAKTWAHTINTNAEDASRWLRAIDDGGSSANADVRLFTAMVYSWGLRVRDPIAFWEEHLDDPDPRVQELAIDELCTGFTNVRWIPWLVERFAERRSGVERVIFERLLAFGMHARGAAATFAELLPTLDDEDRWNVVRFVVAAEPENVALHAFLRGRRNDVDESERGIAWRWSWRLHAAGVMPLEAEAWERERTRLLEDGDLVAWFEGDDPRGPWLERPVLELAEAHRYQHARTLVYELAALEAPSTRLGRCLGEVLRLELLERQAQDRAYVSELTAAGKALRDLGTLALGPCEALLQHDEPAVRGGALRLVAAIRPTSVGAGQLLATGLTDTDARVREHALEAIYDYGPDAVACLPILRERFTEHAKDGVGGFQFLRVSDAIFSLGHMAAPMLPEVGRILVEQDEWSASGEHWSERAANWLAALDDPRATALLRSRFTKADEELGDVRAAVLEAWARRAPDMAWPFVHAALQGDEAWEVAVVALRRAALLPERWNELAPILGRIVADDHPELDATDLVDLCFVSRTLDAFLREHELLEEPGGPPFEELTREELLVLARSDDACGAICELARRDQLDVDDALLHSLGRSSCSAIEVAPVLLDRTSRRPDAVDRLDRLQAWSDGCWVDEDEAAMIADWFLLARACAERGRRPVELFTERWNAANTETRTHLIHWLGPGVDMTGFGRVLLDLWHRTPNVELRTTLLHAMSWLGPEAAAILDELYVVLGHTVDEDYSLWECIGTIERGLANGNR